MKNYFKSNDKKDCNGCGACALKCPKNAITMEEDEEGFIYPVINKSKCIQCNLCEKICSNNPTKTNEIQDTYVAMNHDKQIKKNSSSGGIFYAIAKYIIEQKGIIFGVEFDNQLKVKHNYINNIKDLNRFQGSKYVKSDLNNSYIQVEKFLKEDKYVLFSGTPCQCYGLKKYLNKDYKKLITCEIICHANPSPKIFELYKKNLEIQHNKKIKSIYFRSKKNGWRNQTTIIIFTNGTSIEEKTYYTAFVNEIINRPSCSNCSFCEQVRYSDFTIADFWGIEKIDSTIKDDDTGISLLNVNTDKAREILKHINKDLFLKKEDTAQSFLYNHHCNVPVHKNRKKFFKGISNNNINETNIIKYMIKYTKIPLYQKLFNKFKSIIKKMINIIIK